MFHYHCSQQLLSVDKDFISQWPFGLLEKYTTMVRILPALAWQLRREDNVNAYKAKNSNRAALRIILCPRTLSPNIKTQTIGRYLRSCIYMRNASDRILTDWLRNETPYIIIYTGYNIVDWNMNDLLVCCLPNHGSFLPMPSLGRV